VNFREWNNTLNTVSFASLTNQGLWMMGSLVFTCVAAWLMTRPDQFNATGVLIASGSGMRAVGFDLAAALLFAWTGKSAINAASRFGKSKTAVPYVEAKERGKASAQVSVTPAVHAEKVEKVEVKTDTDGAPPVSHEWTTGDPRAGVL
jgi:hypothetical protein